MKNLLGKKEFRQLKELESIKESMDFSNKTKFSDSLLGRAMNKLFSFAAKQAQIVILRRLKTKLEDEYMAGMLSSLAVSGVEMPQTEKNNTAAIFFSLQNKLDENKNINDSDDVFTVFGEDSETISIKIKIEDKENYKTLIEPIKGSTWKIGEIENEQLEDLPEQFEIIVTSESGTNTKKYKIMFGDVVSNSTSIEIKLVNKENSSDIVYGNRKGDLFTFELLMSMSKYKCIVKSDEENLKIKFEYENNVVESILKIEDLKEDIFFKVTALNGDVKDWKLKIIEKKENLKAIPAGDTPKAITAGEKYQLSKISDIEKQSTDIEKYVKEHDKDCVQGIECNIMLKIKTIIGEEKDKMGQIIKYIEKIPSDKIPEGLEKYVNMKDDYQKQSQTLESLSIELKSKIDELEEKDISDDEFNKIVNDILNNKSQTKKKGISLEESKDYFQKMNNANEETQKSNKFDVSVKKRIGLAFKTGSKTLHPDTTNRYTDEERYDAYHTFMKAVEMVSEHVGYRSQYSQFIFEKYMSDMDYLVKTYGDDENINEGVKILGASFGKTNINDLMSEYKGENKENIKKVIELYGDVDYGEIDSKKLVAKFREDSELRKKAESFVNKESLKAIALKASWMYKSEKYKDQRNDHYSRVNFTTTEADQNKIENTWKTFISDVKAMYSPFFNDESGNFPNTLDPIALINSDETFRKNFDQYGKKADDVATGGVEKDNDNIPTEETLNDLKLTTPKNGLQDSQYGMIMFNSSGDEVKDLGMIVKKTDKKFDVDGKKRNLHIFKFVGLFNFGGLVSGIEEAKIDGKVNDEKLKELIEKNNYSGLDKIQTNAKEEEKSKIIELYNIYRPSLHSNFKNRIKNSSDLSTFFVMSQNIIGGSSLKTLNSIQLNAFKDKTNKIVIDLTKVINSKSVNYVNIEDNIDPLMFIGNKSFKFYAGSVATISTENSSLYVTNIDVEKEKEKTDWLIKNENSLSKLVNILNTKK